MTMIEREADLEERRDHRSEAADVSSRVDSANGVRQRRADEGDLAGEITSRHRRRVEADEDRDADEADGEAGQTVERDSLVPENEGSDDDHEQRDRGGEDRRQRGVDRQLCPGDQRERDRDVDRTHDDQVAVGPRVARKRFAGDPDHDRQEQEPEEQPQRDQRERRQAVVDPDLDEQVAAAPHEADAG